MNTLLLGEAGRLKPHDAREPAPEPEPAQQADKLVNINTASLEELTTLPDVGPAKASAIIAARPFASVDDLKRVSGIGAKRIEQLRDLVTTD